MRPKNGDIWYLRRLPARLDRAEAGALLGFSYEDIGYLVKHRLLKPLGYKSACQDWFATVEIEALARDAKWLGQATKTVREAIKAKNKQQLEKRALAKPNM